MRYASLGAAAWAASLVATAAVALEPVAGVGSNPGELDLFVYAPEGVPVGVPLVVALHGCTQEAAAVDAETGLTALADTVPFVVAFPQQRDANNERRCFNFFASDDNRPGRGESASIMAMIDLVEARFETDPERVYVLGLSAGGGMTAVVLANHPQRFAGGAVIAGVPYACNRPGGLSSPLWFLLRAFVGDAAAASYACGIFGYVPSARSPESWGDAVRDVAGRADDWPLVSLWHGEADATVHPANLDELVAQWTNVHGIDIVPETVETIAGAERRVFADTSAVPRVEAWRISDYPHAWPVDAEAEPVPCGSPVPPNIEDADLCAVQRIARFWGLVE